MSTTTQVVTVSRAEYELLIRAKQIIISAGALTKGLASDEEVDMIIDASREVKNDFIMLPRE